MTEAEKKTIATKWASGMSLAQIYATMSGYSRAEFDRTVKQMKTEGEFPKVRLTAKDKVRMALEEGERDHYRLAERFGITVITAIRYKTEFGYCDGKRPPKNYKHSHRTEEIIADLKGGALSVAEIAKKHGVKWQSVHNVRKRFLGYEPK